MNMDKRTEQLQALANFLLVIGIAGIAICCIAQNTPLGYIGIMMVAVGFIGAISFDSMAQISFQNHIQREENKLKHLSEQMDYLRGVNYTFKAYVADNGCSVTEFVKMYDELNWDFEKLYAHYEYCAGDAVIQTRNQVRDIIWLERRRVDETA